jgi:transcriptional regulator with XRE-family HTH domain
LRSLREAAVLTQEEIAGRSRLSAKFVSEVENGHASPSIDTLAKLVELGLGISLATFFATEDERRDDLAQMTALLGAQSAAVRKRALRVLRALCDD